MLYLQLYVQYTWGGVLTACSSDDDKSDTTTPSYTVTIASGIANGAVKADKTSAEEKATVTLTLTPATGYEFESLTVKQGDTVVSTQAVTAGKTYTFAMPKGNVTVSATFKLIPPPTYTITVTSGIATPASAVAGATVTITANAPESGKAFDKWTTTDGLTFASETSAETTFTMPAKAVSVTATYKDESVAETKTKPDAIGDVVLNDGSAVAYGNVSKMSAAQKAKAIAVIFYVGTGLNSDDSAGNADTTTIRTLGVGLYGKNLRKWCLESANAYGKNIASIRCPRNGSGNTMTFTGDKNGSNNLEQIGAFLTAEGLTDDTATAENYPAFYFAKNYAKDTVSNISSGSDYAKGWYIPTCAEFYQIYINGMSADKVIDMSTVFDTLGGELATSFYWVSTQSNSSDDYAFSSRFSDGFISHATKDRNFYVCAIREF